VVPNDHSLYITSHRKVDGHGKLLFESWVPVLNLPALI
jgi:hypothetical protein